MDRKDDAYKAQLEFEVNQIRSKYLPQDQNKLEQLKKLDKKVTVPGKKAVAIMVLSILVLFAAGGTLIYFKQILPGTICCVLGLSCAFLIKPVFNFVTEKERTRLAPQIMRLSDEILGHSAQSTSNKY
ncbi:MAG: hypothetical protein IKZ86_11045 [Spirochaetaceae bacterium]|nr:hypothetical protein [Spirochaetaceae bacterium]